MIILQCIFISNYDGILYNFFYLIQLDILKQLLNSNYLILMVNYLMSKVYNTQFHSIIVYTLNEFIRLNNVKKIKQ